MVVTKKLSKSYKKVTDASTKSYRCRYKKVINVGTEKISFTGTKTLRCRFRKVTEKLQM